MPRVFPKGSGTPKKRLKAAPMRSRILKSSPRQLNEQLESQLSEVIEPATFVPERSSSIKKTASQLDRPIDQPDMIRALDAGAVSALMPKNERQIRKPVTIRFEQHDASPYVVKAPKQAKPFVPEVRVSDTAGIREWVAPFKTPPSIDRVISEVDDLYISSVDPRLFVEQFTPAEADIAYSRQFGLLARLREPFIRWEVVFVKRAPAAEQALRTGIRLEGQPILINVPSLVEEQFTVLAEDEPTVPKTPWYTRILNWARRSERRTVGGIKTLAHQVKMREEDIIVQTEAAWGVPMVVPRLVPHRVIIGLFGLLAVVSLPAGAVSLSRSFGNSYTDIRSRGVAAVEGVKAAIAQGNGDAAWAQASTRFQEADQALSRVNAVAITLAQALPQARNRLESVHALLQAGDKATQAAQLLSQGMNAALTQPVTHLDERLQIFNTYLDAALPRLQEADAAVQSVDIAHLPSDMQAQVVELQAALALGQKSLQDVRTMSTLALAAIGHDRPRTYLILFQNQTELRPTGGFMGSFAEVTFDQGDIKHIFVPGGGPYDLRDQLKERVLPPKPLQLVSTRWEFQDANWFPDFPAAAKKIQWFWSKAGQPTLDGVIAVNSSVLQKLLVVTGPIEMPEYGKTITAENYLLETQKAVELEYDKTENKPKKFIGDLLPKVLEKMKGADKETMIKFAAVMTEALEIKDVQVFFNDAEEEALVEEWGWNGRLAPTPGDMLAVIEANIAGQKTDGVIDEEVTHVADIQEDGSIIDTVTLKRTHNGQAGELFKGANNVAYVRVYVPQGSQLLDAAGFQPPEQRFFDPLLPTDPIDPDVARFVTDERVDPATSVVITNEFGYTAVGGWMQLAPGSSSATTFRYRLPFTTQDLAQTVASGTVSGSDKNAYLLLLTSQSGKANRTIDSRVTMPDSWKASWSHTPFASSTELIWDRDRVVAHLLTQHDETTQTAP